jgi:hypothetical protein
MDTSERPRKQVEDQGKVTGRRRPAVSKGVAQGKLKGKPLEGGPASGMAKAPVAAARRTAVDAERTVSARKELPLPSERGATGDRRQDRSLRLRLRVEGERITVLDALEVDVPAPVPEQVRGTDFLEVRAGDEVLALQELIDPGIAIGIPDPRDKPTAFRGHREVVLDSYELTVRVPLDAVDSLEALELQGTTKDSHRRRSAPIEISVFRASETVVIGSRLAATDRVARDDRLERVASTGELSLAELRTAAAPTYERKPDDRKDRATEKA